MVIAPPTLRKGSAYKWTQAPGEYHIAECPQWLLEKIIASQTKKVQPPRPQRPRLAFSNDTAEVEELLSCIPPDCGYQDWLNVLMALHDKFGGSDTGLSIADNWSASGAKYEAGEVESPAIHNFPLLFSQTT